MKLLTFLTLFIPIVNAQTFFPPTEEDLKNINIAFLNELNSFSSSSKNRECSNDGNEKTESAPPEEAEFFCICNLQGLKEHEQSLLNSLIGEKISQELVLTTGNDNFLHGALQNDSLKKYDGNDRGRTFSGGIDYTLSGKDGEFKIKLDSTGFSTLSNLNGNTRSSDGKRYLNFREVNTLDIRLDKNILKDDRTKTFFISELKFTNETDSGNFSRNAQKVWHGQSQKLGLNVIQYNYLKENPDRNTTTLLAGIGKEWIHNLGNWKCQSHLEAQGGMSVNFQGKIDPEIASRAEHKLINSSLPWLALTSWLQASSGFSGTSKEAGLLLSAEKKIKKVTISPFLGVERHETSRDKKYGGPEGNPYEVYHVLGVKIKY